VVCDIYLCCTSKDYGFFGSHEEVGIMYSRYHSRFFDCLAHPNLIATLATDQK
jgi:hypothetical protein